MASVLDATMRGRAEVTRIDRATRRQMLDAYRVALDAVERELARGDAWIQAAIDAGQPVSEQWLRRQTWYRQLEADIARHMQRFSDDATRILANGQMASLGVASTTAQVIAGMFAGRVNAPAFARWVSAMQQGTPIRGVIDAYGDRVSEAVLRQVTEGIGTGQGSRTITRRIMQEVGTEATEYRIATLTRTEALRAYRGGFHDAMVPLEQQGIITGYRWTAALSARTCIACVGLHGATYNYYPTSQHPSCRCVVTPVVRSDLVPGGRPPMTGDEWFARQDEATQRAMLPSDAHWEAYQRGMKPSAMVTTRQSRTWGESVAIRPTRDIGRREAA